MPFQVNQPVFYKQEKTKAIVKAINEDDTVKITYFKGKERKFADVKVEELDVFKVKKKGGVRKKDTLLFAKVRPTAIIPSKRHEDGCYDVYANFDGDEFLINPGDITHIPTGIASSFSPKYRINTKRERGSTGKIGLTVVSGQIDSGYRGEWFIALNNTTNTPIVISKNVTETTIIHDHVTDTKVIKYPYTKAICQAALEFVPNVDVKEITYEELEKIPSERGKGKLGQSGK